MLLLQAADVWSCQLAGRKRTALMKMPFAPFCPNGTQSILPACFWLGDDCAGLTVSPGLTLLCDTTMSVRTTVRSFLQYNDDDDDGKLRWMHSKIFFFRKKVENYSNGKVDEVFTKTTTTLKKIQNNVQIKMWEEVCARRLWEAELSESMCAGWGSGSFKH